ncbi:type II toxin-antitoxin system death-on-curing family toxin [Candidatus Schmidhempelia bombi]|nr:type II toxin-antitoxin system death-on-curing family toxin [Candidatus Schmidhempelia bombi]
MAEWSCCGLKNHPLTNANKRMAMFCSCLFLLFDGQALTAPDSEVVEVGVGIAIGEYNIDFLDDWLFH